MNKPTLYGLMAEFVTPEALVAAARRAYAEGYRRVRSTAGRRLSR
jgi:hypothetical protein